MRARVSQIAFVATAALLLITLAAVGVSAANPNGGTPRVATLTGAAEVSSGDEDGSGAATIILNHGQGTVCWSVWYQDIAPPTAAHIHAAPAGVNGPVVVPLSPIVEGCASVAKELIKAIIQSPDQYYVNVHNAEFPGGAVRGQLSNRGQNR